MLRNHLGVEENIATEDQAAYKAIDDIDCAVERNEDANKTGHD